MSNITSRLAAKQKKLEAIDAKLKDYNTRREKLCSEIKELQVTAIQQKMADYKIPFHQIDMFLDSLNPKNAQDPNQINLFEANTEEDDTAESVKEAESK